MRAKLTLPAGTALVEIVPTAEVLAVVGGTDGVTVSETVTLTAHGDKWEYRSNDATSRVKKLKLNWHGGEFRYDGLIGLKLRHMGESSTSLEIDPKGNKTFTITVLNQAPITIRLGDHLT